VRLKLKYCLLTLVLAGLVFGQNLITPNTVADITGDGNVHAVATPATGCRYIIFAALSTNTNAMRLGDSNITTSRGVPVGPGQSFTLLESPSTFRHGGWYYLVQSGDKISITYGL
jgi:hypothetical protein